MGARILIAALVLIPVSVTSVFAQTVGIREVTASERSLIPLHTKIRYTTMIVLPEEEEILDVVCGDKDFWIISAIDARRDLPTPSYVLLSSPDRVHVFWRATGFTKDAAERLQKLAERTAPWTVHAITSSRYARVHHDELASRVLDLMAKHPAWHLPLAYKDGEYGAERVPSGAYLGDRDMFTRARRSARRLSEPISNSRNAERESF